MPDPAVPDPPVPAPDPREAAQRSIGHDGVRARHPDVALAPGLDGRGQAVEHREIGLDLAVAHGPLPAAPAGPGVEGGHHEAEQTPARGGVRGG